MKKLNKILALLFIVIAVFCAIYFKDVKILAFLILIGLLFVLKMNHYLTFIVLIFGFLGYFLGFSLHLYKTLSWYDTFIHFTSGIFLGFISIYVLNLFKIFDKKKVLFNVIYVTLFVLAISSCWEIIEFTADNLVNSDMQRLATGVRDTMKDIISAFFGSILFNMWFYYEFTNNNKLLIYKFIDGMIGGSYGR